MKKLEEEMKGDRERRVKLKRYKYKKTEREGEWKRDKRIEGGYERERKRIILREEDGEREKAENWKGAERLVQHAKTTKKRLIFWQSVSVEPPRCRRVMVAFSLPIIAFMFIILYISFQNLYSTGSRL